MTERRRPARRGRSQRPSNKPEGEASDNPYRDDAAGGSGGPESSGGGDSGGGGEARATVETTPEGGGGRGESRAERASFTESVQAPVATEPPRGTYGGGGGGGGGETGGAQGTGTTGEYSR